MVDLVSGTAVHDLRMKRKEALNSVFRLIDLAGSCKKHLPFVLSCVVTLVDSSHITLTTPAGTAGARDVVVTNKDGQTVIWTGAFTYTSPPAPFGGSDGGSTSDRTVLFAHEMGHSVFGLVDTYCGDTYYYQNDPLPNVWSSLGACMNSARAGNRDPAQCQQIKERSSSSAICSRNFWKADPAPDIMANSFSEKFGPVSTQRIAYVLSQCGGG